MSGIKEVLQELGGKLQHCMAADEIYVLFGARALADCYSNNLLFYCESQGVNNHCDIVHLTDLGATLTNTLGYMTKDDYKAYMESISGTPAVIE